MPSVALTVDQIIIVSEKTRKLYQCSKCHHQTSFISGTIFEQTKLTLNIWFLAIHLITQAKTGLSALTLKRQIGVSYNTAWSMKQKIMQVMKERDDSKPLTGTIQLDDVYWGGEYRGGKRGRGSENKVPFVAAVSLNENDHPIAMNMNVIEGFRLTEIAQWARQHLQPDGTTAAMRLFGQTFPDLFSWLVAEMGVFPLPRKGRERATHNPLFLKTVPA